MKTLPFFAIQFFFIITSAQIGLDIWGLQVLPSDFSNTIERRIREPDNENQAFAFRPRFSPIFRVHTPLTVDNSTIAELKEYTKALSWMVVEPTFQRDKEDWLIFGNENGLTEFFNDADFVGDKILVTDSISIAVANIIDLVNPPSLKNFRGDPRFDLINPVLKVSLFSETIAKEFDHIEIVKFNLERVFKWFQDLDLLNKLATLAFYEYTTMDVVYVDSFQVDCYFEISRNSSEYMEPKQVVQVIKQYLKPEDIYVQFKPDSRLIPIPPVSARIVANGRNIMSLVIVDRKYLVWYEAENYRIYLLPLIVTVESITGTGRPILLEKGISLRCFTKIGKLPKMQFDIYFENVILFVNTTEVPILVVAKIDTQLMELVPLETTQLPVYSEVTGMFVVPNNSGGQGFYVYVSIGYGKPLEYYFSYKLNNDNCTWNDFGQSNLTVHFERAAQSKTPDSDVYYSGIAEYCFTKDARYVISFSAKKRSVLAFDLIEGKLIIFFDSPFPLYNVKKLFMRKEEGNYYLYTISPLEGIIRFNMSSPKQVLQRDLTSHTKTNFFRTSKSSTVLFSPTIRNVAYDGFKNYAERFIIF